MDDYISKQKAKGLMGCCLATAKAEYKAAKDEFIKARFGDYISAIQAMIDVIDRVETADVQPLRHGRWLPSEACITIDCQVCSECRSIISMDSFYYDYCPVCGAKMDGEV